MSNGLKSINVVSYKINNIIKHKVIMNYISDLKPSSLSRQAPEAKSLNPLPAVTIYKKITPTFYSRGYEIKMSRNFTNRLKSTSIFLQ